jgi:PKD repeat protein
MRKRTHSPPIEPRALIRWALALGCCVATVAAPAMSRAETYGELHNFGSAGVGHGQFKITPGTNAFGVDTADNSVYVGDELKKGEYRIQKLTAGGTFLAQTAPLKVANHDGLEGIAIDDALKRVYVLALEKRATTLTLDPNAPAAGTLYAFSTEQSGEALEPAAGTGGEGVLAGPSTLEPQSEAPGRALLGPKGIAVDPTTHDVIVLGETYAQDVKGEPQLSVALQRVHSSGALGERYTDGTEFFGPGVTPNSPVVSPTGSVYVVVQQAQLEEVIESMTDQLVPTNQLVRIPSDFSSAAAPTPYVKLDLRGTLEGEGRLVEFDSNEPTAFGAGLSFAPEGSGDEGTIYARAHIFVGPSVSGSYYPGVLAFDGADGSEIGWTGGQTRKASTSCAISFGGETYSAVAAGREHTVFMFDPGTSTTHLPPRVVEFGPGGSGCPTAEASEPAASVNGQALLPSEPVTAGTNVTFSSTLTQANALRVEWSFGDGQTQTDSADEYRHTEMTHAFARGGELTVTETIHTDDLATATIVKTTKIDVSATAPPPTAILEGPTEVTLGGSGTEQLVYLEDGGLELVDSSSHGEATFDASASYASSAAGPNSISTYHWKFGDGHSETTSNPTIEHTYEKMGAYRVELTVTDAHGLTSEPAALIVKVKNAPEPLGTKSDTTSTEDGGAIAVAAAAGQTGALAGGRPATGAESGSRLAPDVMLKNTKLRAGRLGTIALDLSCPRGESDCTGTVTVRMMVAFGARTTSLRAKRKKEHAITLAAGRFTISEGQTKAVVLRLTSSARAMLARTRTLRARATILARDPAGATHVTQTAVTLRAH